MTYRNSYYVERIWNAAVVVVAVVVVVVVVVDAGTKIVQERSVSAFAREELLFWRY